jgi:hypothetical protein
VLVLVAVNVPEFPCQAAICKSPSDLVNNVMMGLFRSVVDVFKDCDKAGLAVTSDFDDAFVDVMECGNGFCDDDDCTSISVIMSV